MDLKGLLESKEQLERNGNYLLTEMYLPKCKEELTGTEELEIFAEIIRSCDEFKNCTLRFMNFPAEIIENQVRTSVTMKIKETTRFYGECYLYHLSLTPLIYNPENFTPYRGVIVRGVFENVEHN